MNAHTGYKMVRLFHVNGNYSHLKYKKKLFPSSELEEVILSHGI